MGLELKIDVFGVICGNLETQELVVVCPPVGLVLFLVDIG
jgi:hypothetical protein